MNNSKVTYSVGELTQLIKELLEGHFPSVWVSGEISNFVHHRSGHMYFTLKDKQAEIKAVMFKGNNQYLHFRPENGMQILIQGRISVYEQRGYYQIIATRLEPAGIGTLYLAFEALKKQLAAEGLFTPEVKQKLPPYPRRIGVITSATGAAFRDIIKVLQRRAPQVQIILRPSLVQGDTAADDIVQAVLEFTTYDQVDVLIVGRGGGSLEDLWPFNEEAVARALFACPIPIISAVGHETDTTIADLVADLRAPTPSAAAELVAPSQNELLGNLDYFRETLTMLVSREIEKRQQQLDNLIDRYGFRQPLELLDITEERLDRLMKDLFKSTQIRSALWQSQLVSIEQRLQTLNPNAILSRGYALAVRASDGRIIRKPHDIKLGQSFNLHLAEGKIRAQKTANIDE